MTSDGVHVAVMKRVGMEQFNWRSLSKSVNFEHTKFLAEGAGKFSEEMNLINFNKIDKAILRKEVVEGWSFPEALWGSVKEDGCSRPLAKEFSLQLNQLRAQ